jgi:predicted branched-subunit amino acid permease
MPGPATKSSGSPANGDSGAAAAPAGTAAGAAGELTPARPVRDGVGLGLAVGVSGVAFGAAAVSSGLSTWQACALSLLAFTGASQFALAGVIAGGGSLLAGTAGAILLGSRNTLYGLRLAGLLRPRGPLRLLTALGVIDETTAITLAQPDRAAARTGFATTFCCLYLTWNLATLAGALGANRIGSPQTFGLDVVGPAAFLALIWPRLRAGRTERMVALGGVAIAVGTTPVLPVGVPVILAAAAALAGSLRRQATDDSRPGSGAPQANGAQQSSAASAQRHDPAAVRESGVTEEAAP